MVTQNAVHRISWTWNRSKKLSITKKQFKKHYKVIKTELAKVYPSASFVFQLEKGEKKKKLHYQGHLKFTDNTKVRLKTFYNDVKHFMPYVHASPSSRKGSKKAEFYCMKEEGRVKGPWCDDDYVMPDYTDFKRPLRGWQVDAHKMIEGTPDERSVIWLWEHEGQSGKSVFKNSLIFNDGFIPLGLNSHSNNAAIVNKTYDRAKGYILDIPRTRGEGFKYEEIYQIIEQIKDRVLVNTKYEVDVITLPRRVHLIVLANEPPPDKHTLTLDRWRVYHIQDEKLNRDYTFNNPN